MTETYRPRVKYVIGPDGSPLTIADLPRRNHAEMGHPAKGGSRRSRPRGAFISRRSLQPLYAYRRRISELADVDRPAWTRRAANDEAPAISRVTQVMSRHQKSRLQWSRLFHACGQPIRQPSSSAFVYFSASPAAPRIALSATSASFPRSNTTTTTRAKSSGMIR